MLHPGHHPQHLFRIGALGNAMHLAQAEGLQGLAHLHGATDAAPDLLDADRLAAALFRLAAEKLQLHASAPSATGAAATSRSPRRFLYCSSVRRALSASNVALTTLCGLAVPRDLVRMFWMPADSRIARTGPPAMTPEIGRASCRERGEVRVGLAPVCSKSRH